MDLAPLHAVAADFVAHVDFLFQRGGRTVVESCFVQSCMRQRSAGQVQIATHSDTVGHVRALGKPGEEAVQRCVHGIAAWADTAEAALEAEFWDFFVLNVFAVFAMSDQAAWGVAGLALDEALCQRLAKVFLVKPQELASQLASLWPAAQAITHSNKRSNHEAWQKAAQWHWQARADALKNVDAFAPTGDAVPRLVFQHHGRGTPSRRLRLPRFRRATKSARCRRIRQLRSGLRHSSPKDAPKRRPVARRSPVFGKLNQTAAGQAGEVRYCFAEEEARACGGWTLECQGTVSHGLAAPLTGAEKVIGQAAGEETETGRGHVPGLVLA